MTSEHVLEVDALRVEAGRGRAAIVDDVRMRVGGGSLVVVLGPAGSGKTTLLRAIAGLERVASGSVRMAGVDQTRRAVERRPSTLVFHEPVLLPDTTVHGNVAFAADEGRTDSTAADVVEAAITALGLGGVRDRRPHTLSHGQRQRVALARALVRRPAVLLLDEPLASIEPVARRAMRGEILRIHRRMGCATVYATHDAADALAIADRVVVLREGRIVQEGAPRALHARPASTWVAQQLGLTTFLRAVVAEDRAPGDDAVEVELLGVRVRVAAASDVVARGQRCVLVGGTTALRVAHPAAGLESSGSVGRLRSATFLGDDDELEVETEAGTVLVRTPPDGGSTRVPGSAVHLMLDPARIWALAR